MVVSLADFSMSLFGGLTIFSMLGLVDDKISSQLEGTSLPFVIYPKALMLMPLPKLWASFFFLTLILLGVGSFGPIYLSGATMAIDQWPALGKYRPLLVLGQAVFYFVCGCLFCTEMGYDYFTVMNEYGPGFALLFVVFLELICCIHIYGYTNFRLDLMSMFGVPKRLLARIFSPSGLYLKYMWLIVSPLAIFTIDDLLIADENDSDRRPSAYKIYTENAITIAPGPPKPARTWAKSPSLPAHSAEENPAELNENSEFQSAFAEPAISVPHRHIPFKSTLL
ncbi:sodium:neurotransmitter symporter family domain-containing protein [Ditylenchus destructor]|uniref:Sodium:neurotransmitter symporter family domain-containing protein n=1 Tax=Ditylenchus destructor TaxID=166010 RepID=A0AAD4R5D7_9BILA|nr:sodium:neurotransmitter symporter family domain-containing protein [Ditylenchus destructor]